ncbi:MAG TPA: amino acid adenylation domain-containing protein, partial [Candidatus Angelobacter sp.]|nr:amino acid adenylation domain-containing protein [Candidatus Angelobacter sp.]
MFSSKIGSIRNCETLVDLLDFRAKERADALAYRFLLSGDVNGPTEEWKYGDLFHRARAIASRLQEAGAKGDRALLLYPAGLDFIAGFLGCACAGIVAVPSYPHRNLSRLEAIAHDAQVRFVLTTNSFMKIGGTLKRQAPELADAHWMATDDLGNDLSEQTSSWRPPQIDGKALAFIQYTSGSTGQPKGVMVSHANILHNERLITEGFGTDSSIHVVGWLPVYHDMGLIGNVLQPLYLGAPCTLMAPLAFLQRPMRWLEAISHYQGTVSGGPNFAFDLCVSKKPPECPLDLSSWEVAFNGSEPIRKDTLDRFAQAFASCGFKAKAFYPCYGLAEATLFVTGSKRNAGAVYETVAADAIEDHRAVASANNPAPRLRTLVSSGRSSQEQQLLIVNPERGIICPERNIGEIWISGPSVARGYWGRPEESSRTFAAHLASDDRPFLRTGDLGFMAGGELYVTGRLKDLIILRGRNLYPQDIEMSVEAAHPAVRPGCCAAFSLEVQGHEELAVAAETTLRNANESWQEIIVAMRQLVAEEHGVHLHTVILLKAKTIPKTSSGKIRRDACRKRFLTGELEIVATSATEDLANAEFKQGSLEEDASLDRMLQGRQLDAADPADRLSIAGELIRRLCAKALATKPSSLSMMAAPASVGLDSLRSMEVQNDLEAILGLVLPDGFLWQHSTLRGASEELVRIWEEQRCAGSAATDAIKSESLDGEIPVSSGQQRLWFLHHIAPEVPVYNIHFGLRMQGRLDIDVLRRSLLEVVKRQAILRTVFRQAQGQLVQTILPVFPLELPVLDLRKITKETQNTHLFNAATAIASEPFDLAAGPLVRFHLAILGEDEHVLLITQHHIITDAWSVMLLGKELAAIYAGYELERPVPPRPAIQFADYARWEQRNLANMEQDRQFWADRLSGLPQLGLATDRPAPQRITNRGSRVPLRLSPEVSRQISELGHQEGCTPFVALLAGYSAFLLHHTGQEDFAVGTGIAQRSQNGLRDVAGFLVNTVVLRCDLSGSPGFRELLRRMSPMVAEALQHGKLPFGEVVKITATERDSDLESLLQTNFVLENVSLPEMDLPEMLWQPLSWAPDGAVEGTAKFDLSLLLLESKEEGFHGVFEYSSDLFERATVERFARRLETLFTSIVQTPDLPLGALSLLSDNEAGTLFAGWSGTATRVVTERSLPELLAYHAQHTPQNIAIVSGGTEVRYADLQENVCHLAGLLNAGGVKLGDRVAVCLERTSDVLAAAVGIFSAGGVFVPLDANEPQSRMEFQLEDSGASWIMTDAVNRARFQDRNLRLIYVEPDRARALPEANVFPVPLDGENPACILYRSGPKGEPEGILIKHRMLSSPIFPELEAIAPADRIALSFNFWNELTSLTSFHALAAGAGVVDTGSTPLPPRRFAALLKDKAVSVLFSSVTQVERIAREFPRAFKGVRLLVCQEPWNELYGAKAVLNSDVRDRLCGIWGWTETNGACGLLPAVQLSDSGFALQNEQLTPGLRAYVLNEQLDPVPDGIVGEMYIGAENLAAGYANDPARTAGIFIPDPFTDIPGSRLFRTGSLVRLHSGRLKPCGRRDRRIVVDGLRIHEEEIEAALSLHKGIAKALVTERVEQNKSRLAAFVVETDGGHVSADELQNFLRTRLPEKMAPQSLFIVEKISPRNCRALLKRTATKAALNTVAYEAPRNSVEERLTAIWSQTLHIEQIGIRDNFFRLGGHSLLATQVVARISDVFQLELPLRRLFEAPTIAEMAKMIQAAEQTRLSTGETDPAYSRIERVPRNSDLPLSFAQQRLWFLDQMMPGDTSYNIPGAVWIEGPIDSAALEASLNEIVRRHEALRTRFLGVHGEPQQVVIPELRLQIPADDLEFLPPELREVEAQECARKEAQIAFDLSQGPLLRARLLRLGQQQHVLLVTIHHIVSDGWSLSVLMRELTALYKTFSQGLPSPLPELPVQYVDYSFWQRKWLSGTVLQQQLGYWEKQLADIQTLDLPTDRQRPPVVSNRGAAFEVWVPAEIAAQLRELGHRQGATLFMVLLSGFQAMLYRYTRQTDLAVGSPIAGRKRTEFELLIGFFVNTLVLRTDLSGNPHFIELLGRVKETTLQAYAHQDVPFEKLVEELAPERDLARMPLFQVMFALQNATQFDLTLGTAKARIFNVSNSTSKFDLFLSLQESEGGLRGSLEYNTDIFEQQSIVRMIDHYLMLLAGIIKNPLEPIGALPLLTADEERLLLHDWNHTEAEYLKETCLHEMFEQQVLRTPGAVAIEYQGNGLRYADLNARANQLGRYLRKLNVGPETPVGICMERNPDLIVGMIGILKSGGAYIPMDPNYPSDRLTYMLESAQATVLLTQRSLLARMPAYKGIVVVLDEQWAEISQESSQNLEIVNFPENLAYVIYTSGSTGKPKGIAIRHSSAVVFLCWAHQVYSPEELARVLASTSVCFDISVFEIFAPLSCGGTAVLVENALSLPELPVTAQLTLLNTVPSAMAELLRMRAIPSTVRTINLAGEALAETLVQSLIDNVSTVERIFNLYGPSEDTTYSTFDWWQKGNSSAVIPIGRPISNTRMYVLNQALELLPVGIPGELYLGGEGLARGYLNRSDLTAERFVPDSLSGRQGERLYRTGDLVRYLPSGKLQYLGRIDHQVKIRGYRIELGEIESALQSHPQVEKAVVLAREDSPGDHRLVGYVVPRLGDEPHPETVEWQREQLSQWEMVWDRIYAESRYDGEATLNITGWNSSYTGEPLPEEDMREWAQSTVGRIQTFGAQRILEIGCGTGLVLLSIAPQCQQYVGTDISTPALEYIASRIKGKPEYKSVILHRRSALDVENMEKSGPFDLVILNSVIQYFPGADYLVRVLAAVAGLLREGGYIFVGDVRNRSLLEVFHTSIELARARPGVTVDAIRRQVSNKGQREEELVVDPRFFHALSGRVAGISHAEILLRRGVRENEMTKFRYDVVLQAGVAPAGGQNIQWMDWQKEGWTLTSLREALAGRAPAILAIKRIPNARVRKDVRAVELLAMQTGSLKIAELRELLQNQNQEEIHPEQIHKLAEEFGFEARVTWSGSGQDGLFDAWLQRTSETGIRRYRPVKAQTDISVAQPWHWYMNNPLQEKIARTLGPQLRGALKAKLPDYMVPGDFVVLATLPLTPNGKIDRKKLPKPEVLTTQEYVAPRNVVEQTLCHIWSEVLKHKQIGIEDNFFEMGGHSLLATQVIARIREAFRVEVPMRLLFEAPTVAGLAAALGAKKSAGQERTSRIVPVTRNQPLPLSFAQQRLWFLDQLEPGDTSYNVSGGVRISGKLEPGRLERSLQKVVRRHEALRTRFVSEGGEPRQVIEEEVEVKLEQVDLQGWKGEEQREELERRARAEAQRAFDLGQCPLLRAQLVVCGEQEQVLLLTMHHIVSDGWSLGVLLRETAVLYESSRAGEGCGLAELEVQYADYSVWQREWMKGEVLEEQL